MIPQRGLTKAYQSERVRHLPAYNHSWLGSEPTESREGIPLIDPDIPISPGEVLVDMQGVRVSYGDMNVLGNWEQEFEGRTRKGLYWRIRRGERWGVFGPNGMCYSRLKIFRIKLTAARIWKNNPCLSNLL